MRQPQGKALHSPSENLERVDIILDGIAPSFGEYLLVSCAAAVGLGGLAEAREVPQWTNMAAPILLSIGLIWGAIWSVRRNSALVWSPLVWARLAMVAYSGIGSLTPFIASAETYDYVTEFFQTYPSDILKYNLVSSLFSLIVLVTASVMALVFAARGRPALSRRLVTSSALDRLQTGVLAVMIGAPFHFLLTILPMMTGDQLKLPNIFTMGEMLLPLGYALLTAELMERRSKLIWLLFAAIAMDATVSILQFNKTAVLFPVLLGSIGAIYQRPTGRTAVIAGAILVGLYFVATPVTTYGRQVDWDRGVRQPTFERSIDILLNYEPFADDMRGPPVQQGWARIAYFGVGSFAIARFDQGSPGSSLDMLGVALIPRFLFPDKPVITQSSNEFNYLMTGNDQSASNPGIPSEGYWDYGWLGVIGFAVAWGLGISGMSIYAVYVLRSRLWHLLPLVLLGIRIGERIDGMFVSDYLAPLVLILIGHFVLLLMNEVLMRRRFGQASLTRVAS